VPKAGPGESNPNATQVGGYLCAHPDLGRSLSVI